MATTGFMFLVIAFATAVAAALLLAVGHFAHKEPLSRIGRGAVLASAIALLSLQWLLASPTGGKGKAFTAMRAYLAGIPYPEGGKEILEDMSKNEYYYETIFYLIFSFMNRHIQTQVKTCRGRADMVMYTRKTIYVFELKINKPAQEALAQIDEKGYMIPYTADGRSPRTEIRCSHHR